MRAEFAAVRSEMRAEFADVRGEMRAEFASVRSDMNAEFARQTRMYGTWLVTSQGVVITVVGLLLALTR